MNLTKHNKEKDLSRQEAMECIPLRNPEAIEYQSDEGLLLHYPITAKPLFHSLISKLTGKDGSSVQKKLQLDHLGSSVWELIDGKRSVKRIATIFQKEHQLDRREAETAIATFLKDLGKRGLVAMRTPPQIEP